MKSLLDGSPPDLARQIHPDWRKNEVDDWAIRDQLLGQYRDQWIGRAENRVILTGITAAEVLDAVLTSDQPPFLPRVGREQEPWCRLRGPRVVVNP